MPDDDARLTDFVEGGEADDGEDAGASNGDDGVADTDASDADNGADADPETVEAAEPAVSTADLAPDGAACEACGTVVQRRWRDDGALVCADCKDW